MKFFAPGLLHEMNPIHVVRDPAAMNTAANPDLTLTASIQFIYILKYMGLRAIKHNDRHLYHAVQRINWKSTELLIFMMANNDGKYRVSKN